MDSVIQHVQASKGKIQQGCRACGHRHQIDTRHKLSTFIIKNPPNVTLEDTPGKKLVGLLQLSLLCYCVPFLELKLYFYALALTRYMVASLLLVGFVFQLYLLPRCNAIATEGF